MLAEGMVKAMKMHVHIKNENRREHFSQKTKQKQANLGDVEKVEIKLYYPIACTFSTIVCSLYNINRKAK